MNGLEPGTWNMDNFAVCYRNWLLTEMCADGYSILFDHLYNTEFKWTLDRDEHRAMAGQNLRRRFEDFAQIPAPDEWSEWPCSFLEMVIALAYSIEDSIMYDPDLGDRVSEWFWMMMTNLGLHVCTDRWLGQNGQSGLSYIDDIVQTVMNRTYDFDGSGGLFPLKYPDTDQRNVEFWYQANAYILEQELC